ncbi:MAG: hypothetical protein U9P79_05905, partial [Candidatus Cloacimonadota bacterium]|nr:hypothetical protein [Candidatus Cloacimonadota bacterium]
MFKNMKIGQKTIVGFVLVLAFLIVLAFVILSGLNKITKSVETSDDQNRLIKYILEARREEKNYVLRGGKEYIAKVEAWIDKMNKQIDETEGTLEEDAGISEAVAKYKNAFDQLQNTFGVNKTEVLPVWKEIGAGFNKKILAIRSLSGAGTAVSEQAYDVEKCFILHRVAAVYYIGEGTEENWTAFQSDMAKTKSSVEKLVSLSNSSPKLKNMASEIDDYVRQYIIQGDIYHKNQINSDLANETMVTTARKVQEIANHLREEEKQIMLSAEHSTKNMTMIFGLIAFVIGIVAMIVINRAVSGGIK